VRLRPSLLACAWSCAWSCCALLGCAGGTETGNPSFEGQLAYDAYSSDVTTAALSAGSGDPPVGATVIDSVWLVLGDISFSPACTPASDAPVHATGIGEGDHAAQGRVVTALALAEGEYCSVRVPLERAPEAPTAGPAELAGHSILIQGIAPDGAHFRVRSALQSALELTSATPFELNQSAGTVLIGFDLAVWIEAIDWSEAVRDGDVIVIDEQSNVALLARFEAALASGTGLYRSDGDSPESAPIDSAHPLARGE
jgi:hypothetical protein